MFVTKPQQFRGQVHVFKTPMDSMCARGSARYAVVTDSRALASEDKTENVVSIRHLLDTPSAAALLKGPRADNRPKSQGKSTATT